MINTAVVELFVGAGDPFEGKAQPLGECSAARVLCTGTDFDSFDSGGKQPASKSANSRSDVSVAFVRGIDPVADTRLSMGPVDFMDTHNSYRISFDHNHPCSTTCLCSILGHLGKELLDVSSSLGVFYPRHRVGETLAVALYQLEDGRSVAGINRF